VKVLITGADGFIGRHLSERCVEHDTVLVSRKLTKQLPNSHAIGDMSVFDGWETLFDGVDVIVHLAAKVHQMDRGDPDTYYQANQQVVGRMVDAAVAQGVKRFIFISTIKACTESRSEKVAVPKEVDGNQSDRKDRGEGDGMLGQDPYAHSKSLAEQILIEKSSESSLEVVIIRPPLVYGPGVKANFMRLWDLSARVYPLPFASINNRRDMVSVYNLCDLIILCLQHPAAKNKILNVSDGRPYSLAGLLTAMRQTRGMKPRLLPCPKAILQLLLSLMGRNDVSVRLLGNLEIDISETCRLLDWQPNYSMAHTLQTMIERSSDDV